VPRPGAAGERRAAPMPKRKLPLMKKLPASPNRRIGAARKRRA
jgi:hypothetical protein